MQTMSTARGSANAFEVFLPYQYAGRMITNASWQLAIMTFWRMTAFAPIVFSNSGSGCQAFQRYPCRPTVLSAVGVSPPLAVKLTDLLLDGIARFEQRSDRSYQLRAALDQLLGSCGEDMDVARPITRPRFLRRPRTWFSRSRLILISIARLASSALTEWLSISWTSKPAGSIDSAGTSSQRPAPGQQPGLRECPPQTQVRREGTACRYFHNERAMRVEAQARPRLAPIRRPPPWHAAKPRRRCLQPGRSGNTTL